MTDKSANATEALRELVACSDAAKGNDWLAEPDPLIARTQAAWAAARAVLAEPLAAQAERLVRSILADQAPSDALVREVAAKIVRELPRGCRVETPANIQETAVLPGEPSAMADQNRPVAALIERLRKPLGANWMRDKSYRLTEDRADEICLERREAADALARLSAPVPDKEK